jgi:hypothetical protein
LIIVFARCYICSCPEACRSTILRRVDWGAFQHNRIRTVGQEQEQEHLQSRAQELGRHTAPSGSRQPDKHILSEPTRPSAHHQPHTSLAFATNIAMQNIPQDLALGSTQQGVVPKPPVAPPKPADQRADTPPIPLVKVTSENTAPDNTPGSKPALPARLAPPEPADQRSDTPPIPHVKVTSEDGAQESSLASTPPLPARMTRAKPAGQPDDGLLKPPARTLGPTPTGKKPNRLFGPKHLCPPDKTIEYKGGIHMQSWVKCPGERFWSHERS